MQYPQARILVFSKAPQAGAVKTRLAVSIGDQAAAQIHEFLVLHCLRQLMEFELAPVELWCSPDAGHEFFQRCRDEFQVSLKQQVGLDLGQRMQHALAETLTNSGPAIVIGTDCPIFSYEYLSLALANAEQGRSVIGPAEDGGYVLIAMRKIQPAIFDDMPWGTSEVYQRTISRLCGEVTELPALWDVDNVEDLVRLKAEAENLDLEPAFFNYLKKLSLS